MRYCRLTGIFLAVYVLFVVLSPGLIMSLPSVPQVDCKGGTRPIDHAPILMSGHTNWITSLVHAIVFGTLVGIILTVSTKSRVFPHGVFVGTMAAAFFYMLVPGQILSLPAMPMTICKKGKSVQRVSRIFFSGTASPIGSLWQGAVATGLIALCTYHIIGHAHWKHLMKPV